MEKEKNLTQTIKRMNEFRYDPIGGPLCKIIPMRAETKHAVARSDPHGNILSTDDEETYHAPDFAPKMVLDFYAATGCNGITYLLREIQRGCEAEGALNYKEPLSNAHHALSMLCKALEANRIAFPGGTFIVQANIGFLEGYEYVPGSDSGRDDIAEMYDLINYHIAPSRDGKYPFKHLVEGLRSLIMCSDQNFFMEFTGKWYGILEKYGSRKKPLRTHDPLM